MTLDDLEDLFILGSQEQGDSEGAESLFIKGIIELVEGCHQPALDAILSYCKSNDIGEDVLVDLLYALSQCNDNETFGKRKQVLCDYLISKSPRCRYGAIYGLSILNDMSTLAPLKQALDAETNNMLRKVLEQVIKYLNRNA